MFKYARKKKNMRQVTDYEIACICKHLGISPEWLLQDLDKYME